MVQRPEGGARDGLARFAPEIPPIELDLFGEMGFVGGAEEAAPGHERPRPLPPLLIHATQVIVNRRIARIELDAAPEGDYALVQLSLPEVEQAEREIDVGRAQSLGERVLVVIDRRPILARTGAEERETGARERKVRIERQ